MAPKRKAEADATTTGLTADQYNTQQAEQREYLLSAGIMTKANVDSEVETTPPAKKAKRDTAVAAAEQTRPHSAPESSAGAIAADPETTAPPAKKTPGRKRKTPAATAVQGGTAPTTAGSKTKKPASAPRKPRKKKGDAATTTNDAVPGAGASEAVALPPLTSAVKAKVHNVMAFISTSYGPSISRASADSNCALVRESDLIAALMAMRADYGLGNPYNSVSLTDAENMIVERLENGWCTVDFDRAVPIERGVQAKIRGRSFGLEDLNLLEVEMEMMAAEKTWLKKEGYGDAGVRVWDDDGRRADIDARELSEAVLREKLLRLGGWRGICPASMLEI